MFARKTREQNEDREGIDKDREGKPEGIHKDRVGIRSVSKFGSGD
jgi:hypothetical protein